MSEHSGVEFPPDAEEPPASAPDEVTDFWELARVHAKMNAASSYFGPTPLESVPPPTWSFGATPEEADAGLAALLSGQETALRTPLADFADGDSATLPTEGLLGIVLDGLGHPRALVVTTSVDVVQDVVTEQLAVVYAD